MSLLNRPSPSPLHHRLLPFIGPNPHCYCEDPRDRVLAIQGSHPPTIICSSCWKSFGPMPSDQWAKLHRETLITIRYREVTHELRVYQQNHPNQEVFMTDQAEEAQILTELPSNLVATIPGHIIFNTPQEAADGSNCSHRWIITEDDEIKCILCEGVRKLTAEELQIIETAEQAGVVFLAWPSRFDAMERARGSKRRRSRKAGSKATGGVKIGTEVPEGYLPVKEAAAKLGTDPKRLRKKIRSGLYEAVKVGNRVFVKLETLK